MEKYGLTISCLVPARIKQEFLESASKKEISLVSYLNIEDYQRVKGFLGDESNKRDLEKLVKSRAVKILLLIIIFPSLFTSQNMF